MINKKCEENQIINNAQTHTNPVILCKPIHVQDHFISQNGMNGNNNNTNGGDDTKKMLKERNKKKTKTKKQKKYNICAVTSSAIANTQTPCQGTLSLSLLLTHKEKNAESKSKREQKQ